tara:strand:- start:184 stop:300 length:117 start_codon:yes stop_codon:yes gene_type:complete
MLTSMQKESVVEKMKKKGAKGSPSAANFKRAAMTVRKK